MVTKKLFNRILGRQPTDSSVAPPALDSSTTIDGLYEALPDSLNWEWDDRFDCVVAAFEVDEAEAMLKLVSAQLTQQWDRSGILGAPRTVQKASKDFGGLNRGQLLLAGGLTQEIMLLGLWWPWGHGSTISIRFAPYAAGASDEEVDFVRVQLKKVFDL